MRNTELLDELMESNTIKSIGLKKELVSSILGAYSDLLLDSLLSRGHVELDNGMVIEVVQLLDRVHVLRGVPYKSSRKYKLKLTMEEGLYKKIEEYYNRLGEDIL